MMAFRRIAALFTGLLILLDSACQMPERQSVDDNATTTSLSTSGVPDMIDACRAMRDINAFLNSIITSPRQYLSSHDSCVLGMLDSLTVRFLTSGDNRYLDVFNALAGVSDGYVSTALYEIAGPQLLRQRPEEIGQYLLEHRGHAESLENMTTWAAAIEIVFAADRQKTQEEIRSLINNRFPPRSTVVEDKAYFVKLWQDVEENIRQYEE